MYIWEITVFKLFIWDGISSDIQSENFYGDARAIKRDFRTYIRRYTFPNEKFEYDYPCSNALLKFYLKLERCKPHDASRHPTKCDVINYAKLFPTVLSQIFDVIQSEVALQKQMH